MSDITPIVPLTGELAMPEKVWMQGPPGAAATVTVGTVTTGEPGTDAVVRNSGTESAAVLDFAIPKGENGEGVPDGGTVGQLLGKTETGTAWIDPPQSGGGGSVPKPLTYDYMPEGYPKKEQGETVIVENQTISGFQENTDLGVYLSSNSVVQEAMHNKYPENSPTIKILWDGTEYECQYINAAAPVNLAYGNTSLLGVGEDTGEPFLILMGEYLVISKTTGDSHEIKVSAVTENITPMAEEFLPILTSPNGTKYKITVDDTGTLTATEVT